MKGDNRRATAGDHGTGQQDEWTHHTPDRRGQQVELWVGSVETVELETLIAGLESLRLNELLTFAKNVVDVAEM